MTEQMAIWVHIEYIKTMVALLKHDATGVDLEDLERDVRRRYDPREWESIAGAALRVAEDQEQTR
jgi:hypothetical protein